MKSLLTFSLLVYSTIAFGQWQQTSGPTGGSTSDIIRLSGHLFVNGSNGGNGGIFRSGDDGETWVAVNNGLPSNACYAMTSNGQDLIASIYGSGLYRSSDLGETWAPVGLDGKTFYALLAVDHDIYAAWSEGGLYYSGNDGQSWTFRNDAPLNGLVRDLVYLQNTLFIALPAGIYKSHDKGETLLQSLPGSVNFLSGSGSSLFTPTDFTTNLGETWSLWPNNMGNQNITTANSNGDTIYVAAYSKFLQSNNNGVAWTEHDVPGFSGGMASIYQEHNKLIATGKGGVFISSDDGETWIEKNSGLRNQIIQHLTATSTNIFAGTSTGIFSSADKGETWSKINNGLVDNSTSINQLIGVQIKGIHEGPNKIITATTRGVYTLNDDQSWTSILDMPDNSIISMAGGDSRLFVQTQSNQRYSGNEGTNWTTRSEPLLENMELQAIVSGDTIVAIAVDKIFISTNFGETWNDISIGNPVTYETKAMMIGKKLIVSTYSGIYLYSFDNNNWTKISQGLPTQEVVSMVHVDKAIYAGTTKGVFVSYDTGLTWYPTGDDDRSFYPLAANGTDVFAGTYGESVWATTVDNLNVKPAITAYKGTAQIESDKSFTITLSDLEITDPDSAPEDFTLTIVPGDNYTVSGNTITSSHNFSGQLGVTVHVGDGHSISENFVVDLGVFVGLEDEGPAVNLYPNPANHTLWVSSSQISEYKIRDMTGREVLRGSFAGQSKEGTIDISAIAPGPYLIEVYGAVKKVYRFAKTGM